MNIIIAGAGRVGYRLAKTLSVKNDVFIIDKNAQALNRLQDAMDIMTVVGDIQNPDTYRVFAGKSFDLFIAVTDSDEVNILSTLIVTDIVENIDKKIIRLRNHFFAQSSISDKLEISEAVFPFTSSANAIGMLLDFPKANNIKDFIFVNHKLVSVLVQNSEMEGQNIQELNTQNLKIVGFERNKKFFIPREQDTVMQKDLIYMYGDEEEIKQLCSKLDIKIPKDIKKIAIFGANTLGLEIAKNFLDKKIDLKLIDNDENLCKKASEVLQDKAMVINSRYIENSLYEEENLKSADMIIATSGNDEANIIKCMEAKEYGIQKTIAINNNIEYYNLMHKLGIVAARGPKNSAYYSILEKISSSAMITERHFCGGRGSVFMRKIFSNSSLIGKTIKVIKSEDIQNFLLRENMILSIEKEFEIQNNDVIIVFLKTKKEEEVKEWIYHL